ncbi:bifunctional diguanylate cyclase/phosphodiesterase [Aureimonas populi]|uniref:EAL domain-containing protein n=1 Tax=Aureimonas populi TaxID=1701758 RepID=A0ABW5CR94_9HYPH|nr:EAL domain-containing protein [Aureimonas populi]
MFTVLECVLVQHDRPTVVLAAGIALAGMAAFFLLLARAEECDARRRGHWTDVAACAGGLSIWATHFVAMLAYRGSVPLEFGLALTVVSAAIPVLGFRLALLALKMPSLAGCVLAALAAAGSIAAMHFIGMSAIRAAVTVRYETGPILMGALASAAFFGGAFQAFRRLDGWTRVAAPAGLGVLGICVLHFTGMSATQLAWDAARAPAAAQGLGRAWLVGVISAVAVAVTLMTALAVVVDRYLTDLKGLADATLEGMAIVRDGRIVEANARFAALMETKESALLGRSLDECLLAADGRPAAAPREGAVEASPCLGAAGRVFEMAVHTIEYRGRPCQVLAIRDLTEKKAAQRRIEHLARHDALTDLPNRILFAERANHALARARRSGEAVAVLALDLDRFKAVNDLFGHAEGDRVLKAVADILQRNVRSVDTVARIGGDEFVILQVGAEQPQGARFMAERILETFRAEMNTALDPTAVGVSIGVALFPRDGEDEQALRCAADIALYRAKSGGRGAAAFYDPEMDRQVGERRALENDLRYAVARRQLRLVYQPLMVAADGTCAGYEALLRWTHHERGEVPPDVFIPCAEETGAIIGIGEWVLAEACRAAAGWDPRLSVAVNVSAVQFRLPNLADTILDILSESGLDPARLELEITETALIKDRATTLATLHRLKERGVRVVMDDFGTGYSSLRNLHVFPFDKIKIDRGFITAMEDDGGARAIVRAVIGLGRSLALPVVAEGVETRRQLDLVTEEGCTIAQGFLFGEPGIPQGASAPAQGAEPPLRPRQAGG